MMIKQVEWERTIVKQILRKLVLRKQLGTKSIAKNDAVSENPLAKNQVAKKHQVPSPDSSSKVILPTRDAVVQEDDVRVCLSDDYAFR